MRQVCVNRIEALVLSYTSHFEQFARTQAIWKFEIEWVREWACCEFWSGYGFPFSSTSLWQFITGGGVSTTHSLMGYSSPILKVFGRNSWEDRIITSKRSLHSILSFPPISFRCSHLFPHDPLDFLLFALTRDEVVSRAISAPDYRQRTVFTFFLNESLVSRLQTCEPRVVNCCSLFFEITFW